MPPSDCDSTRDECVYRCLRRGPPRKLYPIKVCEACGSLWVPVTSKQAKKNRTCSPHCGRTVRPSRRLPDPICQECDRAFRPKGNLALSKAKYCSRACTDRARSKDPRVQGHLKKIAPLGTTGWTEEGRRRFSIRMTGERNPAWKGGRSFDGNAIYRFARWVLAPEHLRCMARKDGYIMEHRLVLAIRIGRPLTSKEVVHHRDHYPKNNDPDNLELWPDNGSHKRMEHGRLPERPCFCDVSHRLREAA